MAKGRKAKTALYPVRGKGLQVSISGKLAGNVQMGSECHSGFHCVPGRHSWAHIVIDVGPLKNLPVATKQPGIHLTVLRHLGFSAQHKVHVVLTA
jgi:hypothetical protein